MCTTRGCFSDCRRDVFFLVLQTPSPTRQRGVEWGHADRSTAFPIWFRTFGRDPSSVQARMNIVSPEADLKKGSPCDLGKKCIRSQAPELLGVARLHRHRAEVRGGGKGSGGVAEEDCRKSMGGCTKNMNISISPSPYCTTCVSSNSHWTHRAVNGIGFYRNLFCPM